MTFSVLLVTLLKVLSIPACGTTELTTLIRTAPCVDSGTVKVTPPALPLVGATAVEASSRSWLPGLVTTLKAAGSFQLTLPPAEVPGCLSPLASRASSVTVQVAPTRWAGRFAALPLASTVILPVEVPLPSGPGVQV